MTETNRNQSASVGPLHGIRVIDFTIVMAGPMCTRALADAGADVIKIEAPSGDIVRHRPPIRACGSTYFAAMNCGKRSVVLDLSTEAGKAAARELIAGADIVVENFRPGVMKRLGLEYENLCKLNPRLIYCSISGFGQSGPLAQSAAYAPVIHAASGYDMAYMGYQSDSEKPPNNGIFLADVLGSAHGFGAILLALFDRERTGLGQNIDLSLLDCVLGSLIYEVQAAQFPSDKPRQVYQPVRARDGYVMVAAVTPKNMETLFDIVGFAQGKTDPRFSTVAAKEENWAALLGIIEQWTILRPAAECESTFMAAGVPCSRYRTVGEAINEPHIVERRLLEKMGEQDPFCVVNQAYKLSRSRLVARQRVPALGEHTDEVLKEISH